MDDPRINGERLWASLMEMARIGATPAGGVCRLTKREFLFRLISMMRSPFQDTVNWEISATLPGFVAAACGAAEFFVMLA